MAIDLSIFKDYDVRATYPNQINGSIAEEIAHAIIRHFKPSSIGVVRDMRLSGAEIKDAMVAVFSRLGVDVYDAGLGGTEMSYFIAGTKDYDLVLMISASHNPPEYNGLKLVKKGPVAVTMDTGWREIRDLVVEGPMPDASTPGKVTQIDIMNEWRDKVRSLIDESVMKPLKVVVDAGNGMGGVLVDASFDGLPITVTRLFFEPDGSFPNHIPNPLIESNNDTLVAKVRELSADVGLTFDGDADRMFLIDDKGRLVSGTITTAILARYILKKHPGEIVLYNAICGRIVPETIEKYGGKSKRVRVGHSYIKKHMKEEDAVFAGEHSGHYYHRDFFYAESGVLTALMVLSLLSTEGVKLSALVDELDVYPSSGEINFEVEDADGIQNELKMKHTDAHEIDELDGVSIWYKDWWCNIRASKTEPLLRLNIEADTKELLKSKTEELIGAIESLGGKRKG